MSIYIKTALFRATKIVLISDTHNRSPSCCVIIDCRIPESVYLILYINKMTAITTNSPVL